MYVIMYVCRVTYILKVSTMDYFTFGHVATYVQAINPIVGIPMKILLTMLDSFSLAVPVSQALL